MIEVIEFSDDTVSWTSLTISFLFVLVLGVWIATLDHEARDDSVEDGSVIELFVSKIFEVFDVLWSFIRSELENNFAVFRFNNRYFFTCFWLFELWFFKRLLF